MSEQRVEAIVIGASAGALEALSIVLPRLPADYRYPILIVVHVPPDKKSILAELFRAKCQMNVLEAEDKSPILPGTITFAPPDYHILVEKQKTISLSTEEPVLYSRPSIDVLFETAADAYGAGLIGVILTGANDDGAAGLAAVAAAGGQPIVQQPDTAYALAMPEAAIKACPTARQLELGDIATYLGTL